MNEHQEARAVRLSEFAARYSYHPRTVARWCNAGMPHVGKGRARRVLVVGALAWLDAGGARAAAQRAGAAAHEEMVLQ